MSEEKEIKCVVWDLDETLWEGTILESDEVKLKPGIADMVRTLDSRGILQSVASKGDYAAAMEKLEEFGLAEYFLYPEIGWDAKSAAIGRIRDRLNIGIDSFLFVDDQPFERDEVRYVFPEVLCWRASGYEALLEHPRLNPKFITEDSRKRRRMYLEDMQRKQEEEEFAGPKLEFLESLDMELVIGGAQEQDLERAEELTQRTNQLNTTGIAYSYEELKALLRSRQHRLLVCELRDRYGSYGKIGLALLELHEDHWNLKLFLMSCRVMTRGVGSVLLSHIMKEAKKEGKRLRAEFKHTGRNRLMFVTFKFANFKAVSAGNEENMVLENDLSAIKEIPPYIRVIETRSG